MYQSPQTAQMMCFLWTDLSTSLEFAAIRNWLQRCLSTSWSWESASVVLVAAPPAWVGQIWTLRVFSLSFQLVERIFSIGKLQIQRPTWVLTSCVSICFYMFLYVFLWSVNISKFHGHIGSHWIISGYWRYFMPSSMNWLALFNSHLIGLDLPDSPGYCSGGSNRHPEKKTSRISDIRMVHS